MCRSNGRARALWRLALVLLAFVPAAAAQSPAAPAPGLAASRVAAERAHLLRVGAWGGTAVLSGAALLLLSGRDADGRRAFGMQTAAWGAVNLAIAGVALAQPGEAAVSLAGALADENRLGDILWLNTGLNVGYVAVGTTLYAVGARAGVARPDAWRGHGAAVVVQGLGLLVLDGVALAASRTRQGALVDLLSGVAVVPAAGGLAVTVAL